MNSRRLSITQNTPDTMDFADEVFRLVNEERNKRGLSPYTREDALSAAANQRAKEITSSFSHTRPNGSAFFTVLREKKVPFRAAGENIAYGQRTPSEVVAAWMGSPGHRRNILSPRFKKIGIGVALKNRRNYWDQLFTN